MTELYTLYGAQISNYTAKVRSYLIFKKLLFQEVVATNYIYDKILVPVVGFRMMPVIRMEFGRMYEPTRKLRRPDQDWRESLAWARERLPSLGVTKRTMAQYQASTLALLAWLDDHFAQYPFLLGARPRIADFAFMGPLYGHFYRDPYSFSVMCSSPNGTRWVERMNIGRRYRRVATCPMTRFLSACCRFSGRRSKSTYRSFGHDPTRGSMGSPAIQ